MMQVRQSLERLWFVRFKRPFKLKVSVSQGQGKPLVMLHGIGSSGRTWQGLADMVQGSWQSFAPDLLGFGQSPKPDFVTYSVDDHARAVAAAIKKQFGNKPVTILAHSMGCLIALRLQETAAVRIRRLVLYEPPLLSPVETKLLKKRHYRSMYEFVIQSPQLFMAVSRLIRKVTAGSPFEIMTDNWLPFERSLKHTVINQQAITTLENIAVRTDIIHGRFDIIVEQGAYRRRLRQNKYIHFHKINNAHSIGRSTHKALLKFLDQPDTPVV